MSSLSSRPMILRSPGHGAFLRINAEFEEELGLTHQQLADAPLREWIHPEDQQQFDSWLARGEGSLRSRHRTGHDAWRNLEWRVCAHEGKQVALGLPVLEQESQLRVPELGVPLVHSTLTDTLKEMARTLEANAEGLRCSILLVDEDATRVLVGAGPSLPDEYNKAVHGLHIGPTVGSCGTAAYWNVPVVVEDINRDPLWKDLREAAAIAGVRSCWSVPITASNNGDVLGAMALYNDAPRAPQLNEMNMLEIAARMVGLAIERDRLEEQLRRATTVRAVGVLAGGIAHDFNNLLAVILGNAELAIAELGTDSRVSESLKEIVSASSIATGLCNQMLNYAGRGARTTEHIDCTQLVKEISELLLVSVPKKVTLEFDLSDEPLGVVADCGQLRQVVMNLITNASDAIGTASGRVSVRTRACFLREEQLRRSHPLDDLGEREYVEIQVQDTGMGMNAETQAKIFEPFFTTKPTGRGLGLASVQGILRSHGGAISVDSTVGEGTTFTVILPRKLPPTDESPTPAASQVLTRENCVLVVDDERAVRDIHSRMLKSGGYDVVAASDGREAIASFAKHADCIDAILLDLSMPDLDGEEVFAQLRKIREDVPVILISGFAEQDILDRFQGAGLAGVLHKPVQVSVLLENIGAAIKGRVGVGP